MKKKHEIKTIEDIKYCEEHGLSIRMETSLLYCYKFFNGIWCWVEDKTNKLIEYNSELDTTQSLYYYEEQEQQEATEDDIGKLCWFENKDRSYGFFDFLEEIFEGNDRPYQPENASLMWHHCRRATPSEVAELTGYKVEEE